MKNEASELIFTSFKESKTRVENASRDLGEAAATIYMQHHYPNAKQIFPTADMYSSSSGMFDQVWFDESSGKYFVLDAKGGGAAYTPRTAKYLDRTHEYHNKRVEQDTRPYLEDVIIAMKNKGGVYKEVADQLQLALKSKKINYIGFKQGFDKNSGDLADIKIEDFNLQNQKYKDETY